MPAKAAPKKTEKKPVESSSAAKAKKKKWSKGKVRDKLNNMVRFLLETPLPSEQKKNTSPLLGFIRQTNLRQMC
jgi:hypothetical protein